MEVFRNSYLDVLTLVFISFALLTVVFLIWRMFIGGRSIFSAIYRKCKRLNVFVSNWHLYIGEPYLRVEDEKSGEFAALSHEQKIKFFQSKYAAEQIKFDSNIRVRWVVVSGITSFLILNAIWVYQPATFDSRAFAPVIALLVGAPVALLVWYFRDQNNIYQLERQHHDVTLKEFQKLQEWATGNIADGYLLEESTEELEFSYSGIRQKKEKKIKKSQKLTQTKQAETLQIMALHSLRPYLKGEFGEIFKRGAFEIYTSVLKTEHQKILRLFEEKNEPLTYGEIQNAIKGFPLAKQINLIASEEWFCLLVNHDFPTAGISLLGVNLQHCYLRHKKEERGLDFSNSCLIGVSFLSSNLYRANFRNAQLQSARMESVRAVQARFNGASLQGADLKFAKMYRAVLQESNFSGATLSDAMLVNANLYKAKFCGADLSGAVLAAANIKCAEFRCANLVDADLRGAYSDCTAENCLKSQAGINTDLECLAECILRPSFTKEELTEFQASLRRYLSKKSFDSIIQRSKLENANVCDLGTGNYGCYTSDEVDDWIAKTTCAINL